jgi:nicotinamidase/pyrazinamidase
MNVLFWNVDTQVDFMKAEGALYVPGAETIEPNLASLTQFAEVHGIRVVSTADYHDKNAAEFSLTPDFVNTFPPHCMRSTKGAQYIEATKPGHPLIVDWKTDAPSAEQVTSSREMVIYKDAFNVFEGNPHVETLLQSLSPKRILVYGVATNFCVHDAACGLAERGYPVTVISDAVKEIPVESGPRSLIEVLSHWERSGIQTMTTEALIQELGLNHRSLR